MNDHGELEQAHRKAIEATVTYQIGRLVLDARHSPKALLLLPVKLYRMARHYKNIERQSFKPFAKPNAKKKDFDLTHTSSALWLLSQHADNPQTLIDTAKQHTVNDHQLHKIIKETATIAASSDAMLASNILENLPNLDHDPAAQKQLAFILYTAGNLTQSSRLLQLAQVERLLSKNETMRAKRIIAEANIYENGFELPPVQPQISAERPTKIMFVCHTSFPHHNNGYAVRTHNIALEIKKLGYDVQCVSRPGYPWDRKDAVELDNIKLQDVIEGVPYFRYHTTNVTTLPLPDFVAQAAETLKRHIEQNKITHVIAASNFVNALPALIAARKSGTKFTYDVRGLWEYTNCSKIKHWEKSDSFQLSKKLETQIANSASSIISISSALKTELVKRGVNIDKITIALNATRTKVPDISCYRKKIRKQFDIPKEAIVFGYIGSVEKYEGLQNLITATKFLIEKDKHIYLLIVGSGAYTSTLYELARDLKITSNIRWVGSVPAAKAQAYYAAIDICVYPRIGDKVCEIVPPLKPLEAMAHGKSVIITDLPPMIELVGTPPHAAIAMRNNLSSLEKVLLKLVESSNFRTSLTTKGKSFIVRERSWTSTSAAYLAATV